MRTYTDSLGATWTVNLSYRNIQKVKSDTGVDLLALVTNAELIEALSADSEKSVEVMVSVLEDQIKDKDDFLDGLNGDTFESFWDALIESLVDFFPSRKQARLRKIIEKGQEMEEVMDEEMDRVLDDLLANPQKLFERRYSGVRESQDSTPGPVPSES